MKILIAEDEKDMQKIIKLYLTGAGHEVAAVSDGQAAFDLLCAEKFDLLISDWMMPVMDGLALCKAVREYNMPIRIIMLTAKGDITDEIAGLTYGAEDYIRKPFEPRILLLRIEKLFQLGKLLTCGSLTLNPDTNIVKILQEEIKLTKKEYDLLYTLILNQGRILSREQLLSSVWGMDYYGDERTLDTHIRRLRHKIGEAYITTHIGIGYMLENPYE